MIDKEHVMSEQLDNGLPFALIRWIKRNQEDIEAHRKKMVAKNWKDDCEQYITFIEAIVMKWRSLSARDKLFLNNLATWHNGGRNFSVSQRSAIATLYTKYVLTPKK
jgi:hypothetical protein